ncbi:MAG: cyclic lactone autoinducer peptide [Lachnospiraceae bacterium]
MKQKVKKFISKCTMPNILALCATVVAVAATNHSCVFIYHQPEMPDELKRLRKF